MTIQSISPQIRAAIGDALAGAKGAAASLGADALSLAESASELPDAPAPAVIKHTAHAIQAGAQRAALGALAACAAAARLETWAHALALDSEAREARHTTAREQVQAEAERDAALYLDDTAPDRPSLDTWAADAFAGSWEDGLDLLGVPREQAWEWYRVTFRAAAHGDTPKPAPVV